MKFLAREKTQEKLYQEASKTRLFGEPYSNKNLADKLKDTPYFIFVDQAKTAISSPFSDGTFDNGPNDKINNYLKDSINAILSGTSEESAADALIQGYLKAMAEYGLETPETEN